MPYAIDLKTSVHVQSCCYGLPLAEETFASSSNNTVLGWGLTHNISEKIKEYVNAEYTIPNAGGIYITASKCWS